MTRTPSTPKEAGELLLFPMVLKRVLQIPLKLLAQRLCHLRVASVDAGGSF